MFLCNNESWILLIENHNCTIIALSSNGWNHFPCPPSWQSCKRTIFICTNRTACHDISEDPCNHLQTAQLCTVELCSAVLSDEPNYCTPEGGGSLAPQLPALLIRWGSLAKISHYRLSSQTCFMLIGHTAHRECVGWAMGWVAACCPSIQREKFTLDKNFSIFQVSF